MSKFSIILPVRNGGNYVHECVKSILTQSISDFQLLVLDNCSTDGTREWLESLKDERIIIYPAEKPLTIEENWHRIVKVPKNEFITLIGHDDILDPHYLAVMNRLITKHPHASLYQTHFRYIDSKGNSIRRSKPMDEFQNTLEFLAFFLSNSIDTMGTGFMMRSADYDFIGGIPPSYPNLLFADFELWINLTKLSYKATAFEECFAFRLHQSATTTSSTIYFHRAFIQFVQYLSRLKQEDAAIAEAIHRYAIGFINFYTKGLAHRLLRSPKSKRSGLTVSGLVNESQRMADELVPGNHLNPYGQPGVKLASQIDSNYITRQLFLLFKKIYKHPVYS
jgi:glycosyltransferase involved in cell wall biosynthesis